MRDIDGFGTNPGNLRMALHVPTGTSAGAPLLLVLPGCGQSPGDYLAAGWNELADRAGFVVAYAQQKRRNNLGGCFNWFTPRHQHRGTGEPASLVQMVDYVQRYAHTDPARTVVTGLSAGAAMTATLLATYPDVFAAGAIVAGVPYRCAETLRDARAAMAGRVRRDAQAWGDLVRGAVPNATRWPRVSLWHGSADERVSPVNLGELTKQWTGVHRLPTEPTSEEYAAPARRQVWCNAQGVAVVESWLVDGLGHAAPVSPGNRARTAEGGADQHFPSGPVDSTYHCARFLGLTA